PELLAELQERADARRSYIDPWVRVEVVEMDALLDHIATLTAGIDVAMSDRQALTERVDALEAALAAERGRREAAEAKLAQVMAALETVERWWNDGNGTSLAPERMAGITSVIAAALAGADAAPSCGWERRSTPCVSRMSTTCAYLSDGTKILLRRSPDGRRKFWMEHVAQAEIRTAEVLPEPEKP